MWETNSYKAHEDHKKLYEALEKSMDRDHTDQLLTSLAEARKKKKRSHDSPKTPPGSPPYQPPPPPLPPAATSAEYTAWTTIDTRFKPSVSSIPKDLPMNDDSAPEKQVHSSDDEDIGSDHIPKVNLKQDWWKPLPEGMMACAKPEPAWYKYGVTMIMRFNEIHKFSDGTLQHIDEALDYRVKEFKVNRMNPGLNIQFWTRKDVDRSKEFMFSIQKWLKTRRI
ncbi:hypothetical protein Tco_0741848, partial [Tanacetum coccineum]